MTVQLLLVEDDPADARLVEILLAGEGFEITKVDELRAARRAMDEEQFDAVLLDLTLPDSRGIETFRAARAAAVDTAIVVTTNVEDHELALTAVSEGAQDYILKGSVDAAALRQAIRYAIERQRFILELRAAKTVAERRSEEIGEHHAQLGGTLRELGGALARERDDRRRLEELDRTKSELLSVLAHDLRNPLQVIAALSDVMLSQWDRLSESKKASYLETVRRNTRTLEQLVDAVLEAARLDEGALVLERRPFDMRALLRSVAQDLASGPNEGRIDLDLPVPGRVALALGDESRQRRILTNLVSNALKYSPPDTRVKLALEPHGAGWLQVAVADRGPGIAAQDLKRLFRKFSRLPAHGARPGSGTGLGLYIAKSLVEAQGGKIWVESRVGVGTTFRYTVPVVRGAAAGVRAEPTR